MEEVNNFGAKNENMTFVFELQQLMKANDVILVYEGYFSQEITKSVLLMTERKFDAEQLDSNVKKKIFNVMVEVLQNICKHQFVEEHEYLDTPAIFMIGTVGDDYLIISGNPLLSKNVDGIRERIDRVNKEDKDGLKAMYKAARLASQISEVGGAGLGFIDMARKSGNQIEYRFDTINEHVSYFTLLSKVSSNQSDSE